MLKFRVETVSVNERKQTAMVIVRTLLENGRFQFKTRHVDFQELQRLEDAEQEAWWQLHEQRAADGTLYS